MADTDGRAERRQSVKLVVVGDGAVGKTCLCYTAILGRFPSDDEHRPTMFDGAYIDLELDDHTPVTLNIWDFDNQEDFERWAPLMYLDVDVVLLCYAINNVTSFNNIMVKWAPELRKHCPKARILLIATKADCRGGDPATSVERSRGRRLAVKRLKAAGFMECSARTGDGVPEVYQTAMRMALERPLCGDGCSCAIV